MTRIQMRRGTAAQWTSVNPILAAGEHGFETDTGKEKIGNGSMAWVALPYVTDTVGSGTTTALATKVTKGDQIIDAADYASLSAAITAAPSGSTILLGAGTYTVSSQAFTQASLTIVGDNPETSIIAAGSNAYGIAGHAAGLAGRIIFRNVGFTGSTSAQIAVSRNTTARAEFYNCRFSGFTAQAISTAGSDLIVKDCVFTSDGTPGAMNAIYHYRGSQSIVVKDNRFRYLNRGLYLSNTELPASNVVVSGNMFDGGWMYLKAKASGSGGTVTYAATTVTDTAATFPAFGVPDTVRAMAAKQTGTVTAISAARLTDSAANFTTAAVAKGDIIRTATAWAVVSAVESSTVLQLEEWLTLSDYQPVATPAVATAYTVYGLLIGRVQSNTGTAITVDVWRDWNGNQSTPAAGTLYEVASKGDYQGMFAFHVDKIRIVNNTFRRNWSDQMSIQACNDAIIHGNHVFDGQDVGITIGQPGAFTTNPTVTNNRVHHNGYGGIWAGNCTQATIRHNNLSDTSWISTGLDNYGQIMVEGGSDIDVSGNLIQRGTAFYGNKAMRVRSTIVGNTDNVVFHDNVTVGYDTLTELYLGGSGVTNVRGKFAPNTKVVLAASAPAPRGHFTGTGSPESVLSAAVGSQYMRTDGGAGSVLYVKETGTGASGWVPHVSTAGAKPDSLTAGEMVMPRELATVANVAMTTQVMRLSFFTAAKDETINSVRIISGATAATATPTLVRIGIYTEDGSGNLTLVASTPNDTTLLAAANTTYTKGLSVALAKTAGQRYALGVLVVSSVAMPTMAGFGYPSSITPEIFVAPKLCAAVNGQTDLPGSVLVASVLNSGNRIYGAVIP